MCLIGTWCIHTPRLNLPLLFLLSIHQQWKHSHVKYYVSSSFFWKIAFVLSLLKQHSHFYLDHTTFMIFKWSLILHFSRFLFFVSPSLKSFLSSMKYSIFKCLQKTDAINRLLMIIHSILADQSLEMIYPLPLLLTTFYSLLTFITIQFQFLNSIIILNLVPGFL